MHQLGLIPSDKLHIPRWKSVFQAKNASCNRTAALLGAFRHYWFSFLLPGQYFFTEHLHCTNIYIKYLAFELFSYGKTVNMLFTAFFPSRNWMVFAHFAHLFAVSKSTECFFPNGEVDESSTPCDLMTEYSSCCTSEDICLSNGLCFVRTKNIMRRQSCTDPDWGISCPMDCYDRKQLFFLMRLIVKSFDMKN